MPRQDAERAGFVLGAQMHDIGGFGDDGERRGDGEPHAAPPAFAAASRSRASSRSPTM